MVCFAAMDVDPVSRDRPNNKDFTKIMANLTLKQKIKPVGQMVHGKILGNI